jgi:hypothetical protein
MIAATKPREAKASPLAFCPHCTAGLTLEEIKSLWGRATSAQRRTFAAGPGRPKSGSRCPCGQMTQARAKQRRHVCEKVTGA